MAVQTSMYAGELVPEGYAGLVHYLIETVSSPDAKLSGPHNEPFLFKRKVAID